MTCTETTCTSEIYW